MNIENIKFRGKRISDDEWVYGCLTRYSKKMSYIEVELGEVYQVRTETVGQFIGLQDKKGVDIYVGDIIELETGEFDEYEKEKTFVAPVVFNENNACFDLEHPKGYHGHWGINKNIIDNCNYIIIGSKY